MIENENEEWTDVLPLTDPTRIETKIMIITLASTFSGIILIFGIAAKIVTML